MAQMGTWTELSTGNQVADGAMKRVIVEGRELLLARVGDTYYCADNRCPHMGGRLSEGVLQGTVVTCPRHKSQFDLVDGRVVRWLKTPQALERFSKMLGSPQGLRTYPVRMEGNTILARL